MAATGARPFCPLFLLILGQLKRPRFFPVCDRIPVMKDRARVHVVLGGRVQGVAFRYYTVKWADEDGVTGWVRNLPDGDVEVLAEGPRENLERFVELLRRGPRMARVDRCEATWEEPTGEFPDFRIAF
jgi:acylphosphatase